jgi:hypothetical protein
MWLECDPPEFYSEDFPAAGKVHRCCECKAPIVPGEKHLYARGKSEGDFWAERQHMLCSELCMLMNRAGDEECCPFGFMKEAFSEGWDGEGFRANVEAAHLMALIEQRERDAEA